MIILEQEEEQNIGCQTGDKLNFLKYRFLQKTVNEKYFLILQKNIK